MSRRARQRLRAVGGLLIALVAVVLGTLPEYTAAQSTCRNVAIRSPFAGTRVRGIVPILGSARIDGFGFYKLEWASEAVAETWSAVSAIRADPVVNGTLDSWDTRSVSDGQYRLKLTVVDAAGQEPCRVTVSGIRVANAVTATVTSNEAALVPVAATQGASGTGAVGAETGAAGTPRTGTVAAPRPTGRATVSAEAAERLPTSGVAVAGTQVPPSAGESAASPEAGQDLPTEGATPVSLAMGDDAGASGADEPDGRAGAVDTSAADASESDVPDPEEAGDGGDASDAGIGDGFASEVGAAMAGLLPDPRTWVGPLALDAAARAFLGGAAAALVVGLLALAVHLFRRR